MVLVPAQPHFLKAPSTAVWDSPVPINVAVHELVLLASKCISAGFYAIHGVLYIIRTGKMSSSQWHYYGIGNSKGDPWVFSHSPLPLPFKTLTLDKGQGFEQGSRFPDPYS